MGGANTGFHRLAKLFLIGNLSVETIPIVEEFDNLCTAIGKKNAVLATGDGSIAFFNMAELVAALLISNTKVKIVWHTSHFGFCRLKGDFFIRMCVYLLKL